MVLKRFVVCSIHHVGNGNAFAPVIGRSTVDDGQKNFRSFDGQSLLPHRFDRSQIDSPMLGQFPWAHTTAMWRHGMFVEILKHNLQQALPKKTSQPRHLWDSSRGGQEFDLHRPSLVKFHAATLCFCSSRKETWNAKCSDSLTQKGWE